MKTNKGEILEQYYIKKQQLEELEKSVAMLRDMIKEIGVCKANGYQSFVNEQERRSISLVEIEKTDKKVYETLIEKHFIKENKILIVKVRKL